VTPLVQAGGSGTYAVANVYSTPNTADVYAGWALIVVYRDTARAEPQPGRRRRLRAGRQHRDRDVDVSGFVTPPSGVVTTRVGVVTYEGDLGLTGDSFRVNGTAVTDAVNPSTNFFNSTISALGANVTTRNPNYVNQYGFDIDLLNANALLGNAATSATISCTTNGDTYYPTVLTFATDLYAPVMEGNSFQKFVTDVNGGAAQPGDILEYTVRMQNTGQDNAVNCVLRDTLAANLTYVPGSFSVVKRAERGRQDRQPGRRPVRVRRREPLAGRASRHRRDLAVRRERGGRRPDHRALPRLDHRAGAERLERGEPGRPRRSTPRSSGTAFNTRSDADTIAAGFQPTSNTVVAPAITGTVFEDVNYGGGAGRTLAASAGVARPNARVELYSSTGAFLQAVTTNAAGLYSFDGWSPGSYTVRVVNGDRPPPRAPGAGPANLGVQTFRTVASTGTAVADAARVGGETPALPDAGANVSNQALAALTTASATPQSIAPVTLARPT
jgi:uncharacterized repeat protein (TIGR01451 family)